MKSYLTLVTSVSGGQIINKPWVSYNRNILAMKNDEQKHNSTWDSDSRFACHDRQVLPG